MKNTISLIVTLTGIISIVIICIGILINSLESVGVIQENKSIKVKSEIIKVE